MALFGAFAAVGRAGGSSELLVPTGTPEEHGTASMTVDSGDSERAVQVVTLDEVAAEGGEHAEGVVSDDGSVSLGSVTLGSVSLSSDVVEAIARDLDVEAEDVVDRMADQQVLAAVESDLAESLGDDFGGGWIGEDGVAHVGVVDPGLVGDVESTGVVAEVVDYSERDLVVVFEALNAAALADSPLLAVASGWSIDPVSNRVVVETDDELMVGEVLASLGLDEGTVRYVPARNHTTVNGDLTGGERFWTSGSGCSLGFAVTGGVLTAGHCGAVGVKISTADRVEVGVMEQSIYNDEGDGAFIRLHAGYEALPQVSRHNGTQTIPVYGHDPAPVGATVCRSGANSGFHCGKVQSTAASINASGEVVFGLIATSVCASSGDSGGPLMWGNQAQGLASSTIRSCDQEGPKGSYYQAVGPLLSRWGLELKTAAPGKTWLHEHGGFGGATEDFGVGVHMLAGSRVGDNAVSSLQVPSGFVVRLCDNSDGTGDCVVYGASTGFVGGLNDRASYLQIGEGSLPPAPGKVSLHQHGGFGGAAQDFGVGSHSLVGSRVGDDAVSSVQVPSGFMVRLCDSSDGTGDCVVYGASTGFVGGLNDRASYLQVSEGALPPAPGRVSLFEHGHFGGVAEEFGVGSHSLVGSRVGDDAVSSVQVPSGFMVRLCDNSDGTGDCVSYDGSTGFVGGLNDRASYLQVSEGALPPAPGRVSLFQHGGFGGVAEEFGVGSHSLVGSRVGDDSVSSVQVPSGFTVRLCENSDGTGNCVTYDASGYVGGNMNDKASYVQVR